MTPPKKSEKDLDERAFRPMSLVTATWAGVGSSAGEPNAQSLCVGMETLNEAPAFSAR